MSGDRAGSDDRPAAPVAPASPADRDRAAAALCRHFARDHLEVAELERRLDLAFAARSAGELDALLADLPELPPEAAPTPAPSGLPGPRVDFAVEMAERDVLVGVMGGTERKGAWTPAKRTFVVAFMGGAALDFREARIGAREIEVTVVAIMGGAEIIAPPGCGSRSRDPPSSAGSSTTREAPPPRPEHPFSGSAASRSWAGSK